MINYHTKTGALTYQTEPYKIGHLGRFVRRGAARIFSSNDLPNVAFANPDDSLAVYVNHHKKHPDTMTLNVAVAVSHSFDLEPHSYYTVVWRES